MKTPALLRKLLSAEAIAKLVDEKTLARGGDYFKRGAVTLVEVLPSEVVAEVLGTDSYDVRIYAADKGKLGYECNCPMGHDGVFCKHCVATALAWFGQGEIVAADGSGSDKGEARGQKPRAKGRPHTQAEVIQSFLQTKDAHELRDLLMQASQQNKPLRDKLLMMARTSGGADMASLRDTVRHATRSSGFMGGHESARYARQLEDLAEMLAARISDGDKGLVEVIELAINKAERALLHIDDSNGYVMPAILSLQRVHLKACTALRPDPLKLAFRLFAYQQEGEWDVFHSVLPQYLDALGPLGLQRYEQLLRERWEPLPTLTAADAGAPWDTKRFRVEAAMETFARTTGEVSFVAHVLKKNLSSPMRYLMLAQLYFEDDMPDDALHFAMEGLDAFKHEHRTKELAEIAIELQLNAGDKDAAQAIAWAQFAARPGAAAFYELMAVAEQLGRKRELEKQALWKFEELMRAAEAAPESTNIWRPGPRSELLAIAIREGRSDWAWDLYMGGQTAVQLWQPLAELRATTHPNDALALYRKLLPMRVQEGAPKARYDAALEVVRAIRELHAGMGQTNKFNEELAAWKVVWGNRRNLMKLLDTLR
jgi:uncharacterized Zn finger protein